MHPYVLAACRVVFSIPCQCCLFCCLAWVLPVCVSVPCPFVPCSFGWHKGCIAWVSFLTLHRPTSVSLSCSPTFAESVCGQMGGACSSCSCCCTATPVTHQVQLPDALETGQCARRTQVRECSGESDPLVAHSVCVAHPPACAVVAGAGDLILFRTNTLAASVTRWCTDGERHTQERDSERGHSTRSGDACKEHTSPAAVLPVPLCAAPFDHVAMVLRTAEGYRTVECTGQGIGCWQLQDRLDDTIIKGAVV